MQLVCAGFYKLSAVRTACSTIRRTGTAEMAYVKDQAHQVGAFESSKSAIKTDAPEFKALMTILRSTGPVISTRRSKRSFGKGATCDRCIVLQEIALECSSCICIFACA